MEHDSHGVPNGQSTKIRIDEEVALDFMSVRKLAAGADFLIIDVSDTSQTVQQNLEKPR
ncbi:MAG: hypothetical protein AAF601_03955 [Pseudomonadota bacterium]